MSNVEIFANSEESQASTVPCISHAWHTLRDAYTKHCRR